MKKLKEAIKNIIKEESEYQQFFKKALEKSGKSISQMSDEEKKAFFNKIDTAWSGKGEKNEELVGNQHKLDIDGDGEIEGSDLAALRAGKKADESITEQSEPLELKGIKINKKSPITFVLEVSFVINGEVVVSYLTTGTPQDAQKLKSKIEKAFKAGKIVSPSGIGYYAYNESVITEEKYTVIDPKGNQMGASDKGQAVAIAKKKGGEKEGFFVVSNKNALKARRALEKFKGDFKNPKLRDMMADLFYESVESVNEATLEQGTKLRYEKNTFVVDYVVDKKYIGRDGYPKYILKVVKSNYPNKIKVGSTEEYEDSKLTGLIRNGVMKFVKNESVNEVTIRKGLKLRMYLNGKSDIVDYELVQPNQYNAIKGGKTNLFKVIDTTHPKIKIGSMEDFSTNDIKAQLKSGIMSVLTESVNEVKYPTDLKIGSVILGQGFTMLKGIEGGRYYKIVDMDDFSATLVPSDKNGNVKGTKKVRHKLDSIEGGIKTAKRGDENGIVVIKESVNEGKFDAQLDKIEAAVKNAKSFMGVGAELKKAGIKYDFTTSMIPMYMVKVPGNTIAIVNKKYAAGAEREVGDTAIGLLEGIVKEGKFKSGDKVTISYPTMIKPLKGVVSMVLNASGNEVLVLKGDAGVWDAKFATLNEGNAFGAAVTAAKQEGKKEFEFNGKKYKVKRGSYEKNESAKKVNEAIDVEYWEDYGGKSPKVTSSAKVKSIVDSAVDEWNSDADSSNMVNSNSRNKILKLATEFFKSSGYIAYDIVMAMIMQES